MMHQAYHYSRRHHQGGFSYVEVMVASVLMVITLLPMQQALQTGIKGASVQQLITTDHYRLTGTMETVLAEPFSRLLDAAAKTNDKSTPSSYSDAGGTPGRQLVYLSFYDAANSDADGDPFTIFDANTDADNNPYTGTDVDISLLWVHVEIENSVQTLESLRSR